MSSEPFLIEDSSGSLENENDDSGFEDIDISDLEEGTTFEKDSNNEILEQSKDLVTDQTQGGNQQITETKSADFQILNNEENPIELPMNNNDKNKITQIDISQSSMNDDDFDAFFSKPISETNSPVPESPKQSLFSNSLSQSPFSKFTTEVQKNPEPQTSGKSQKEESSPISQKSQISSGQQSPLFSITQISTEMPKEIKNISQEDLQKNEKTSTESSEFFNDFLSKPIEDTSVSSPMSPLNKTPIKDFSQGRENIQTDDENHIKNNKIEKKSFLLTASNDETNQNQSTFSKNNLSINVMQSKEEVLSPSGRTQHLMPTSLISSIFSQQSKASSNNQNDIYESQTSKSIKISSKGEHNFQSITKCNQQEKDLPETVFQNEQKNHKTKVIQDKKEPEKKVLNTNKASTDSEQPPFPPIESLIKSSEKEQPIDSNSLSISMPESDNQTQSKSVQGPKKIDKEIQISDSLVSENENDPAIIKNIRSDFKRSQTKMIRLFKNELRALMLRPSKNDISMEISTFLTDISQNIKKSIEEESNVCITSNGSLFKEQLNTIKSFTNNEMIQAYDDLKSSLQYQKHSAKERQANITKKLRSISKEVTNICDQTKNSFSSLLKEINEMHIHVMEENHIRFNEEANFEKDIRDFYLTRIDLEGKLRKIKNEQEIIEKRFFDFHNQQIRFLKLMDFNQMNDDDIEFNNFQQELKNLLRDLNEPLLEPSINDLSHLLSLLKESSEELKTDAFIINLAKQNKIVHGFDNNDKQSKVTKNKISKKHQTHVRKEDKNDPIRRQFQK